MDAQNYATTWTGEESLESLNLRLHDGVPLDELMNRARAYRTVMFETLYPMAQPSAGARVLEFGSGVGWIMEAMLEKYPVAEIVGLDISANMIKRAQERFSHARAKFTLYDGFRFPFPDDYFQTLYSCAVIQHIEKHIAFLLMQEMYRVLAPGGHAVLHFVSVHYMPHGPLTFEQECWNHINNINTHWHHYYSYDELFVIFSQMIGVDDLDIRLHISPDFFYVHFSKKTGRKFLRPEVPRLSYPERSHALEIGSPAESLPIKLLKPLRRLMRG
jgi:ubiquinone/menaquinone biosynthesis C-methylase UbiE